MKKLLTVVAALCCTVFSLWATELSDKAVIKFGTTITVTAENKDNITGTNLNGTFSYDDENHVLTIENCYTTKLNQLYIDASKITDAPFTIKVKGNNIWQCQGNDALHFIGSQGLVFEGDKDATMQLYAVGTAKASALLAAKNHTSSSDDDYYPVTVQGGMTLKLHTEALSDVYPALVCNHVVFDNSRFYMVIPTGNPVTDFISARKEAMNDFKGIVVWHVSTGYSENTCTGNFYKTLYPVFFNGNQLYESLDGDLNNNYTNNKVDYSVAECVNAGYMQYDAEKRTLWLHNISLYGTGDEPVIEVYDKDNSTTPVILKLYSSAFVNNTYGGPGMQFTTPVILDLNGEECTVKPDKGAGIVFASDFTLSNSDVNNDGYLKVDAKDNKGIYGRGASARFLCGSRVYAKGKKESFSGFEFVPDGVGITSVGHSWDETQKSAVKSGSKVQNEEVEVGLTKWGFSAVTSPEGAGSVTLQLDGSAVFNPYKHDGTGIIAMTATGNDDYVFDHWEDGGGNNMGTDNPYEEALIASQNYEFKAMMSRTVKTTAQWYTVFATNDSKGDIKAMGSKFRGDLGANIATLPIGANDYVQNAVYVDGKIYYSVYNNVSNSYGLYAATFDGTTIGAKEEILALQTDYSIIALAYNWNDDLLYAIGYDNLNSYDCLMTIDLTDGTITSLGNIETALTTETPMVMAINSSDELFVMTYSDRLHRIRLSDLTNTLSVEPHKTSFPYPDDYNKNAMAFDPTTDEIIFQYAEGTSYSAIFLVNQTTGDLEWIADNDNFARGIFTMAAGVTKYRITATVKAGQEAMGTVSPKTGKYKEGATVTLTATPNKGYLFDKWDDGSTEATRTITVGTEDKTYTASFKEDPENRPLNIYVCGKQLFAKNVLTSTEMSEITTGSVSYDDATKTLVLNSVKISYGDDKSVISISGETNPLNILVNGECELTHTGGVGCGISVKESKNVTVKGAAGAKLTVKSSNASGVLLSKTDLVFEGIETVIEGNICGIAGFANGEGNDANVTVKGCKMQVKGTIKGSIADIAALNLKYCDITAPSGAKFEAEKFGVAVSGTLTKDNVQIKPDPELRPKMVEEGSGSFTLQKGDDEFTDLGWFKTGDDITITANPAKGYVFVRWTDDTNWQDPDNRKGATRTIENWNGTETPTALFCYETQSAAVWHGVNNGKFISFPMSKHGQEVTEATSPSAAKVNAGDWLNNNWYYLEDKMYLKSMPYTEIDDEGKATPKAEDIQTLYTAGSTINVTDATYNFKEGAFYYVSGKNLYAVELSAETPKPEYLGVFHVKTDEVSVVAIAADASGRLYVLSDDKDALYTFTVDDIDTEKSWVTLTPVGDEAKGGKIGIDVPAGEQSIAFDHVTGELFWGRSDYLRLIDTKEMTTHVVGDFGPVGQKVIKSLHKKDRRVSIKVKVAEGQSEMGTVKMNGKSGETSTNLFVGASVTVEAVAKEGYKFEKWTYGDNSNTNATLTQKVSSARTYTAHFVKATGLDEINADAKDEVRKVMIDGAIYIIRDGRIYGIDGRLVK